jgi:hypothetical protein
MLYKNFFTKRNMMNHTPGPWHINAAGSAKKGEPFKITEIYVYAPETQDDTAVCGDVIDPVTQEPSEANARLISAAPDLLNAAILCLSIANSWIEQEYEGERYYKAQKVLDQAREAIAKATNSGYEPTIATPESNSGEGQPNSLIDGWTYVPIGDLTELYHSIHGNRFMGQEWERRAIASMMPKKAGVTAHK